MPTPALNPPTSPPPVRPTRALKISFGIVGALFLLGAPSSLAFYLATTAPDDVQVAEAMPSIFAALLLVATPPLAGFLAAVLPADPRTPGGQRRFRTVALVSAATVLAGALTLAISSGSGLVSGGATAAIVGGSIVLTTGSLALGLVIRRRDAARPQQPWKPPAAEAAMVRKHVLRVVWTFAITLLVAVIAFVALGVASNEDNGFIVTGVLLATSIAFIASSMVCLIVIFPLFFRAREIFGDDTALQRRVAKMVTGHPRQRTSTSSTAGELLEPDASATIAAARYASVAAISLPFQLAQSVLLLAGIAFGQLSSISTPDNDLVPLNALLLAFVVVAVPITVPFALRQLRRVRNYRDDHPLESLPPWE